MPTSTTVPTVKAYLVDELRARPNIAAATDLEVQNWHPGPEAMPRGIYLGAITNYQRTYAALVARGARVPTDEQYVVEVTMVDWTTAERPTMVGDAEVALVALYDELAEVLVTAPDMDGAVHWSRLDTLEIDVKPFERGDALALTTGVAVMARLT